MVSKQPISKNIRKHKGLNLVSADLRKTKIQGSNNNMKDFDRID
jgi:hypothetical protein